MSVTKLAAGSTFAGCRIEREIGRGGMGVVYRAVDLSLERPVALKLITPELASDEGFRRRFLRESRLAASLDHPHVLPIFSAGEEGGHLYLAMRYVEGADLKTLLGSEGKLDPERAFRICGQVSEALDAAHRRGLVHRDVKPGNVLLDKGGEVYLADFGLTKQVGGASTRTGELVGTLDYLAPEQIRGEEVDGRTDQYALACVLYECLAGRAPFHRATEAEVLWAHMQEAPPALADYPRLSAILATALAKQKEDRYGSCAAFVEAAASALGLETTRLRRRRRVVRRGRILLAAGAAIIAAAAAALAVELTGGGGSPRLLAPNSIGVIDANTNRIVTGIPLPGVPARLAAYRSQLWVGNDDSGTLSALSLHTHALTRFVAIGGFPTDLTVGEGSLWAIDGRSGLLAKVDPVYGAVRKTRVARGNPAYDVSRAAIDPTSVASGFGSIWLTDGSRRLTRIDATSGRISGRIDLGEPLDGVAVGAGGVWAISGAAATAIRLDRHGRVTVRIPVVSKPGVESPYPLEVRVGEGFVWVLNGNTATVTKIDPGQRAVSATIPMGIDRSPARLAVGDGAAWVANSDGTLARIDADTNAVRTIAVGHNLRDVAVGERFIWVTTGSGLAGTASGNMSGGHVRALPPSLCSPIYYAGGGQPQYLIASDLPLQGAGTVVPQLGQAIQFVLRQHRFRAGRYAIGYQSCDDSTARLGHWTAGKCVANAHAYARDRSVIGVIGTFNSPCAALEIPILNRAPRGPLAMISPANTYVGLTRRGPGTATDEPNRYYPTGRRNYVRTVATDDVQAASDALLMRKLRVRKVYVLNDGEAYGLGLAAEFKASAKRLGVKLTGSSTWDPSTRDYTALVAEVKASGAEAVFLAGLIEYNGDALVRDLRAGLGAKFRIIASDGFANFARLVRVPGASAEGMSVSLPGIPNGHLPEPGKAFVRTFGAAVGETPYSYSAAAAQSAEVLLDAIARSDGTRSSVTKELFKTKVKNGILGSFSFDRNGDTTVGATTIYRIVRGRPTVFQVITPPPGLAR